MLSYSDFDMRSIGEKKTAVFLIIHDEKITDDEALLFINNNWN